VGFALSPWMHAADDLSLAPSGSGKVFRLSALACL
jgi:hypothetical protein